MPARSLYFTEPRAAEVREREKRDPAEGEVRVRTERSAISPGTELLVYRGEVPTGMAADATIDALAGTFEFPLRYGYAAVGRVEAVGPNVDSSWLDRRVFGFNPHESHFCAPVADVLAVPDDCSATGAAFLPNVETAVNLVQDGAPRLGERAVVFGQGVVGLLTTALLGEFPLAELVALDCYPDRRERSLELGADAALDPEGDAGERVRERFENGDSEAESPDDASSAIRGGTSRWRRPGASSKPSPRRRSPRRGRPRRELPTLSFRQAERRRPSARLSRRGPTRRGDSRPRKRPPTCAGSRGGNRVDRRSTARSVVVPRPSRLHRARHRPRERRVRARAPARVGRPRGFAVRRAGDRFVLSRDQRRTEVRFRTADAFEFLAATDREFDLAVAHAFVDLADPADALAAFRGALAPDGLAYCPITYDGETSFDPVPDPGFEERFLDSFHRHLDDGGDSRAGRHLLAEASGTGEVLAAAGSDWVVHPREGGYPADEAYFLDCIVTMVAGAVGKADGVESERVSEWATRRREQIGDAELVYCAHQLDLLVR